MNNFLFSAPVVEVADMEVADMEAVEVMEEAAMDTTEQKHYMKISLKIPKYQHD